jgi:hypothetical protein
MKKVLLAICLILALGSVSFSQSLNSFRVGEAYSAIAYGKYSLKSTGTVAAGSATLSVSGSGATDPNGSCFVDTAGFGGKRFTPLFAGNQLTVIDANSETVTLTGASSTLGSCSFTASFANAHNPGALVVSGSFGLIEAIQDAQRAGGGIVRIGPEWSAAGGTNSTISGVTLVYPGVSIEDVRAGAPQNWNVQTGLTTLAAPATLTAATVGFGLNGANTTGGTYTGTNTYVVCIAYVDIMGQEGPCSATFSALTAGTGATNQIGFAAPAASAGAVGYVPYISLTGGTYALAYKVPLVSQPTVAGVAPVSNSVCTLTTVETITPACAVANTTYGQSGSAAIVSALTVNTSPIDPQITTVSSTTVYTPNAGGRTTAVYSPGGRLGANCLNASFLPFAISAAEATTVPSVLGTINVGPGCMNQVGRTLEICGKATTTASTATIVSIQFQWDAMGQNTAGKGVQIGNLSVTPVAAFSTTKVISFCEQFQTTVAGATATAGSINPIAGYIATSGVASAAAGQAAGSDATTGAVASLNLAVDARINVVSVHTTGTDGAALTLQNLSAKFIN